MKVNGQELNTPRVSTGPQGVDGAVGVAGGEGPWFVAIVRSNAEKAAATKLAALGHEAYVALQKEYRVWANGRRAVVDRVVIPGVVFVRCSEAVRREIVALPFISRFMTDKAGAPTPGGYRPMAVVPDREIRRLQFMVGNSDTPVTFSAERLRPGTPVRVIRGKLAGLEGDVRRLDDRRCELTISLAVLGNATLTLPLPDVEPLPQD